MKAAKSLVATAILLTTIAAAFALLLSVPPPHCGITPSSVCKEPSTPFVELDRLLCQMPSANLAFNSPESINLADVVEIQLALSTLLSLNDARRTIEASGPIEGATVRVSDRMEARLSGASFAIAPVTPETQAFSGTETTEWRWQVQPKGSGSHRLHLTLSALLDVAGQATQDD